MEAHAWPGKEEEEEFPGWFWTFDGVLSKCDSVAKLRNTITI